MQSHSGRHDARAVPDRQAGSRSGLGLVQGAVTRSYGVHKKQVFISRREMDSF